MTRYIFNNITFTSKSKIDKYIRDIKNKIIYDEKMTTIYKDTVYYDFFMELLNHHQDKDKKIGCGIDSFFFIKDKYYKDQLFINRIDNSKIDLSYQYTIITKSRSYDDEFNSSLRDSIEYQIINYRQTMPLPLICNICNDTNKTEIDHVIPFKQIKQNFLNTGIIPPLSFLDDESKTCKRIFHKADDEFVKKWIEFHKEHATYQVLCKICNLKKGCKII